MPSSLPIIALASLAIGTSAARAARTRPVPVEVQRQLVGEAAASLVRPGDVVGLGTGRTATAAIQALGRRVRDGLRIRGVPTSQATAKLARSLGIKLSDPFRVRKVDIAIDGADEVDPQLQLVKGRGGALLREKVVASKARSFVVVVDEEKVVPGLGRGVVPVEVEKDASTRTFRRLAALGGKAVLRKGEDGQPFVSDNGNWIVDLSLGRQARAGLRTAAGQRAFGRRIASVPGVLDHGLFVDMATHVLVGRADGSVAVHLPPAKR